jgi:hypothetical protein
VPSDKAFEIEPVGSGKLERKERVEKRMAPDLMAEVVGRRSTSARSLVCPCAEAQLPLLELLLESPFLPAHCHRNRMPPQMQLKNARSGGEAESGFHLEAREVRAARAQKDERE